MMNDLITVVRSIAEGKYLYSKLPFMKWNSPSERQRQRLLIMIDTRVAMQKRKISMIIMMRR
jgi:hypothetical protein